MGQDNPLSLFIPRGFAHGFITLKENTLLSYKLDNAYNPDSEITLTWDDETIDINWPSMHTYHISPKDKETIEILQTMREDEDIHAQQAGESGGEELKIPTKKIMSVTAKVMTTTSAYI